MNRYLLILFVFMAGCASFPPSEKEVSLDTPKEQPKIYVRVELEGGTELTNDDFSETIRSEAYKHFESKGFLRAEERESADLVVVFKANKKVLKSAVHQKIKKVAASKGKGKNVYVDVRSEKGAEMSGPVAESIRTETYRQLVAQGFVEAADPNSTDLKVTVYTNDNALRMAVRKSLEKNEAQLQRNPSGSSL